MNFNSVFHKKGLPPMTPLRNVGPTTQVWLSSIGITSLEELRALGVAETYLRLKAAYPKRVSLNALWGLEGAINERDWRDIPEGRKQELRRLVEQAQAQHPTAE
jgi:hypothetical protein